LPPATGTYARCAATTIARDGVLGERAGGRSCTRRGTSSARIGVRASRRRARRRACTSARCDTRTPARSVAQGPREKKAEEIFERCARSRRDASRIARRRHARETLDENARIVTLLADSRHRAPRHHRRARASALVARGVDASCAQGARQKSC
jgi:hypothetical protein